jgi:hypothetical protein
MLTKVCDNDIYFLNHGAMVLSDSCFSLQHQTRLKRLAESKHSSLFVDSLIDGVKKVL